MSVDLNRFGPNAGYISELYSLYLIDPTCVGLEWATYFSQFDGTGNGNAGTNGNARTGNESADKGHHGASSPTGGLQSVAASNGVGIRNSHAEEATLASTQLAWHLLASFRERGHEQAATNPLQLGVMTARPVPELSLEGIPAAVVDHEIAFTENAVAAHSVAGQGFSFTGTPRQLVARLNAAYCGAVGVEVAHLRNPADRRWLYAAIEGRSRAMAPEARKRALQLTSDAETLESELHKKYVGVKRFSLEGGEGMLPCLDAALQGAHAAGAGRAVIGMAHRGRVNVLANICGKPLEELFQEFEDKTWFSACGAGDVKYHQGYENAYSLGEGRSISVELVPNPSHLEFVNPVVTGVAKARQVLEHQGDLRSVLPVLIHGDAAVIGQGVVAETFNLTGVDGYRVGGVLHIVINNQVGFTANPCDSRSTLYCTDSARGFDMPVFHVNGEDIDACLWVGQLAADWIAYSGRDAMVDVVCYRKYGHNEGDDPTFTQPIMYKDIKGRKTPPEIYAEQLLAQGVITADLPTALRSAYMERFAEARGRASAAVFGPSSPLHGRQRTRHPVPQATRDSLGAIAERLTAFPPGFEPHPKVKMLLERRVQTFTAEKGIDWGFAEVLAFGLLSKEGKRVRLSGQDAGRGTFSQRHLVLHDSNGGGEYQPLQGVGAPVEVFSSVLSEAAVIGYEFGYSSIAKSALTLWEGQFGDFANGAQVYLDQFLSNSEAKWGQLSGLVLLLPHAFEGQGSEHSSARLERYLQLSAEGNMTVVYPTTAAQYFHLLRQHAYTTPQRPLVVMSPKSLLRLGEATSSLDELLTGSFNPVLRRQVGLGDSPTRVIFCSGKVYYDLLSKANTEPPISATLLVRLEQLYPFPRDEVATILNETKGAEHLWVQEEHKNMGAWRHVEAVVREEIGFNLCYHGRAEAASTADGSPSFHARTQAKLVCSALGLPD